MKNVILFISFFLATNLFQDAESKRMNFEQIREVLQPVKKICIERVSVDPKLIDDANKGNWQPNKNLQCYYKCMMVMTKSMTKTDELIEEVLLRTVEYMLEEQYIDPVMQAMLHCQPVAMKKFSDGCELAYELAKCFYEYDKTLMLFP